MKYLAIAGLLCLSACSSPSKSAQGAGENPVVSQRELVGIQGSAVDFNVETYAAVGCAAYDKQFTWSTPLNVTDKETLARISQRLEQLQAAPPDYQVNIRAKAILLYNDDSQDTLCLGNFFNYYRGHVVLADTILSQSLGISHQVPFLKTTK